MRDLYLFFCFHLYFSKLFIWSNDFDTKFFFLILLEIIKYDNFNKFIKT
jgi:hypothetical protein